MQDVHYAGATVASTVPAKSGTRSTETMTNDVYLQESHSQTPVGVAEGTQTDESAAAARGRRKADEDPHELAEFLRRVAPAVEELLASNLSSGVALAFKDYAPLLEEASDASADIKLHASLECDTLELLRGRARATGGGKRGAAAAAALTKLQCTGVSWNSTGATLAASYGRLNVTGWCDEPGALACWNVFRRSTTTGGEAAQQPDLVLDHSSYLMCVCHHPTHPALVAAGSFNGEVIVWDTAAEEPLVGVSPIDDYCHKEPVTQVTWLYDMTEAERGGRGDGYRLLSTSGDGRLLAWTLRNKLSCPTEGHSLLAAPAHRSLGDRASGRAGSGRPVALSASALSFFSEGRLASSLVVGSEGGALVKCTLPVAPADTTAAATGAMQWEPDAQRLLSRVAVPARRSALRAHVEKHAASLRLARVTLDCVFQSRPDTEALFPVPRLFCFEAHEGPVAAAQCSPFHRAAFLSCGADGTARLHSWLHARPVLTLEPALSGGLTAAAWSRARPLVLALACSGGRVYVFDLGVSTVAPVAQLQIPQETGSAGVCFACTLAFNPKQRAFLAAGCSNGTAMLWQLGWGLSNMRQGEVEALEKLCSDSQAARQAPLTSPRSP